MSSDPEEQVLPITALILQLVQATLPQTRSLLPNDLQASVRVLTIVIEVLESNYNSNDTNEVNICWIPKKRNVYCCYKFCHFR